MDSKLILIEGQKSTYYKQGHSSQQQWLSKPVRSNVSPKHVSSNLKKFHSKSEAENSIYIVNGKHRRVRTPQGIQADFICLNNKSFVNERFPYLK